MAPENQKNKELGRLLDQLVHSLVARRGESIAQTMEWLGDRVHLKSDALYKWRRGASKPRSDAIEELVKIGMTYAGLSYDWADRVLSLANHPRRATILSPYSAARQLPAVPAPKHNLPNRPFFVAHSREHERDEALERLSLSSRHYVVPIEGEGGIGKSALALEVAWQIVNGEVGNVGPFDAIVWASAKLDYLDPGTGERPSRRGRIIRGLNDLYRAIADVLEDEELSKAVRDQGAESVAEAVEQALRKGNGALLIIDGLDDLNRPIDPEQDNTAKQDNTPEQDVLAFLRDLPAPTKALVTSRFHDYLRNIIHLSPLDDVSLRRLIEEEAAAYGHTLDTHAITQICKRSVGNPLKAQRFVLNRVVRRLGLDDACDMSESAEHNKRLVAYLTRSVPAVSAPPQSPLTSSLTSAQIPPIHGAVVPSVSGDDKRRTPPLAAHGQRR